MPKHIQIKVQESCHENWNGMQPNQQGRHCLSCQKTVVDFTDMTDAELVSFFTKNSKGNTCGRFNNDQLQKALPIPQKRAHWMKYFFRITLPAFFLSSKAGAQDTTKPAIEVVDTVKPVGQMDSVVETPASIDSLQLTFDSLVNKEIRFTDITTGNAVLTCDWTTLGFTVIEQKDSSILPPPITSVFSGILNRINNKKEPIPQPVPLPYLPPQNFITLFPSPVKPSGVLHVSLSNGLLGRYDFFISNGQGIVFQEGSFLVEESGAETIILLEQLPADDYLLTLVHAASLEKITQQFIVA